ncbi:type B 50S ribosomal protein L31 [Nocardioides acrostichi]|uniref:50S ribosomal protein L31 n=1 Tax=Nocardioides acrostichi TaxID=2784339 RepID=A0A930UZM9_9ACTN|nr:type B 50S ribosomal protein L31 [Nocardioides acrostichi]MBF4161980.1 type B 50S ribosomal protein L31 [Nocardioides acrostichi]
MRPDFHPAYDHVVFRDRSGAASFLTRSTLAGRLPPDHPRVAWEDGRSYPVVDVDVTSASHPFWTGQGRVVDTEGRVQRFHRRYAALPQEGER